MCCCQQLVDDRDADVEESDVGVGVGGCEFDGGVKCVHVVEELVKGFLATMKKALALAPSLSSLRKAWENSSFGLQIY